MSKPKFVYVTYIATTPEKLWQALTDAEFRAQYWFGFAVKSDWKPRQSCLSREATAKCMDTGEVLDCVPSRRLSYSWQPESQRLSRTRSPRGSPSSSSRSGGQVKLTVTHDEFEAGSKVLGLSDRLADDPLEPEEPAGDRHSRSTSRNRP